MWAIAPELAGENQDNDFDFTYDFRAETKDPMKAFPQEETLVALLWTGWLKITILRDIGKEFTKGVAMCALITEKGISVLMGEQESDTYRHCSKIGSFQVDRAAEHDMSPE